MPAGSVWAYLDTGVNLGPLWRWPGFDDRLWRSGPAQLGFGGGDEATHFHSTALSPAALVPGANLIAVEVHQASPESSDLSFDLELLAFPPGALPPLTIQWAEQALRLSWPGWADQFSLHSRMSLAPPAAWLPVTNPVISAAGQAQVLLPAGAVQGYFQLRRQ